MQVASADLGSTMLTMSSQTLSALPTPTHPSAIPAATAQALNNELGRSLLQVLHTLKRLLLLHLHVVQGLPLLTQVCPCSLYSK